MINRVDYSMNMKEVLHKYNTDISVQNLEIQLLVLASKVPAGIETLYHI